MQMKNPGVRYAMAQPLANLAARPGRPGRAVKIGEGPDRLPLAL
jgi:hypothetical protein